MPHTHDVSGNRLADLLSGFSGGFSGGARTALGLAERRRRAALEGRDRELREAEFFERTGIRHVPPTAPDFPDPFEDTPDVREVMMRRVGDLRAGVGSRLADVESPLTSRLEAPDVPQFTPAIDFGGARKVAPSAEERAATEEQERTARLNTLIGNTLARLRPDLEIEANSPEAMALGTGRVPLPTREKPDAPVRRTPLTTGQGLFSFDPTTGGAMPIMGPGGTQLTPPPRAGEGADALSPTSVLTTRRVLVTNAASALSRLQSSDEFLYDMSPEEQRTLVEQVVRNYGYDNLDEYLADVRALRRDLVGGERPAGGEATSGQPASGASGAGSADPFAGIRSIARKLPRADAERLLQQAGYNATEIREILGGK